MLTHHHNMQAPMLPAQPGMLSVWVTASLLITIQQLFMPDMYGYKQVSSVLLLFSGCSVSGG